MIVQARTAVARAVDTGLVRHYWQVGQRIRKDVLQEKRAEYGKKILQTVSAKLVREFGGGYGRSNFFQMVRFAEAFPDSQIVQTASGQLSWSHFVGIIRLGDPLKRDLERRSHRRINKL